MPTEPQPLTLAEAAHKAVEVCDDGTSEALDELALRFEDADEPIAAIGAIEGFLDERLGEHEDGDPASRMARAIITYLHFRRDEIDAQPDELLRLAARAEFDGDPPEDLAAWLAQRGIEA